MNQLPDFQIKEISGLAGAVESWRRALGFDAVLSGDACAPYAGNCMGAQRAISAVVKARTESDVTAIVKIASEHKVPIYPISTGKNWGYGSALPVADNCVIVDLSEMNRIASVDPELGLVTLQPGVTQGQLSDYLDEHGIDFMTPVTGAGPTASIVGNALERGYGMTPLSDHFSAVTSLRAVLPNGEIYQPPLSAAGTPEADRGYKWGVGPYVDGIFAQGAFGVVTEMTITLARRPQAIGMFMFELKSDSDLDAAIVAIRDLVQLYPGALSGINLMNRVRLLSMTVPYPTDDVEPGEAIPQRVLDGLGRAHGLPLWMGIGAMYGDARTLKSLRRAVKDRLKPVGCKLRFFSERSSRFLGKIARILPGRYAASIGMRVEKLTEMLEILSGRPHETALPLAYWRLGHEPREDSPLNPARDGCGLIWYSPLVPLKSEKTRAFITMVEEICPRFGINPLITLTTLSNACFDSTVPIIFDRETEAEQAQACAAALIEAGRKRGFPVYRMNIDSMRQFLDERSEDPCWRLVGEIKKTVDPNNIIAPGRYAPL